MEQTVYSLTRLVKLTDRKSDKGKQRQRDKGEKSVSRSIFATPWTVAHLAPLSLGFSRQEYWRGLPFSSPGHLPNPGIEPRSPAVQADFLLSELPGKPKTTSTFSIIVLRNCNT